MIRQRWLKWFAGRYTLDADKKSFSSHVYRFKRDAQQFFGISCIYVCRYGRATSAHVPRMLIFKWCFVRERATQTTARWWRKRCATSTRKVETKSKHARNTKTPAYIVYDEAGGGERAARRGLETLQRWPEFRRSGKSAGKIHGSLCRPAVWQIVCVYKTHFVGTVPTCRASFSHPIS